MTTGKTIALTRRTFVDKVTSLLFNMLSRLLITFLPRSKHLLISWLQSPSAVILQPRKIKYLTVSTVSPSVCHKVMGPDAMILVFRMLAKFFTLLFHFHCHQEALWFFFTFCHKGGVISVSRLLVFLLAILIPACASSSLVFLMMYCAYKLNNRLAIYSLNVLLFLFGTSLLFHVQF